MPALQFTGWKAGFQVVAFVKFLMREAGWGLKEAKEAADDLLDGQPFYLVATSAEAASQLLVQAQRLGAVGKIV